MATTLCSCQCHNHARGSYNAAIIHGDYASICIWGNSNHINVTAFVPTDDALEAAVACDACRNAHCTALLSRYVPDPDAWQEPPRPADACGDGEGQGDGN